MRMGPSSYDLDGDGLSDLLASSAHAVPSTHAAAPVVGLSTMAIPMSTEPFFPDAVCDPLFVNSNFSAPAEAISGEPVVRASPPVHKAVPTGIMDELPWMRPRVATPAEPALPAAPPRFKRKATETLELEVTPSELDAASAHVILASTNIATAPDIKLGAEPVIVGRDESSTVVLGDARVSGVQFVVRRIPVPGPKGGAEPFMYEFEDRSRNGTIVNKTVVKGGTVELFDHDLVEVLPASKVGRDAAIAFLFHGPVSKEGVDDMIEAERAKSTDSVAVARPSPVKRHRVAPVEKDIPTAAAEEDETNLASSATAASSVGGRDTRMAADKASELTVMASAKKTIEDQMLEGATCVICQEIIHRATSVLPCLHSFCSSCLGRWLRKPETGSCPTCRGSLTGVSRNHVLEGIIDGVLKAYPGRVRDPKQIAELDKHDLLHQSEYDVSKLRPDLARRAGVPLGPARRASDDEDTDAERSDSGSDRSLSGSESRLTPYFAAPAVPVPPCFHCRGPSMNTLEEAVAGMASRPTDATNLAQRALQGNAFERGVVEEWLTSRAQTMQTALLSLLAEPNPTGAPPVNVILERRHPDGTGPTLPATGTWANLRACRSCGSCVLSSLVYTLRERIPPAELPARAQGRETCWYGRNCRTQRTRPAHAARLNHICNGTR